MFLDLRKLHSRCAYFGWVFLAASIVALPQARAQSWPAPSFQVGSAPARPLAFVARFNDCDHFNASGGRYCERSSSGTDANNADLPDHVADLWVLLPNGTTRKLFPLNIARDINLTGYAVGNGAVVEPNASLDGQDLLFSYFPNVFDSSNSTRMPLGADLYRLKLAPLIQDPNFPVDQLQVQRLTFQPSNTDRVKDAMNPTLAAVTSGPWGGIVNMHPIEMVTDQASTTVAPFGPRKLIFVSDRRRLQRSNGPWHDRHHNFNLYSADIKPDGTLININQFQYYTTTSAISPFNLRNGFGFSYIGTTLSDRHWEVQQTNSAGTWAPLQGYARDASNSVHLSTLCATQGNDTQGQADKVVSTSYYGNNNNGFGALIAAPTITAGVNDNFGNNRTPVPMGEINVSAGVSDIEDQPSYWDAGSQRFRGKFSTPRCEGVNTLYAAYSPTSAAGNGSIWQSWCLSRSFPLNNCPYIPGLYDSKIIRRDSITPFDPLQGGFTTIIDDVSNSANGYSYWSLLWPTLLAPIDEKFGNVKPTAATTWALKSGRPYAKVGTSALWNTDVVAPECRFGGFFKPGDHFNTTGGNHVLANVGLLTLIRDLTGSFSNPATNPACLNPVTKSMVYGIALQLTDNKTDVSRNSQSVMSRNETKRLLGVYSTVGQTFNGQEDQSFQAIIPANAPFEFHLLERRTGLKLADVTSWHSLKVGETRNNCGGCHGHGHHLAPVDIQNTLAGQPSYQPANFVDETPSITYNALCQPTEVVKNTPTDPIPLWDDGSPLFQGFVTNCGGCHVIGSPTGANSFSVDPNDAEASYVSLRPYLNREPGRTMDIGAIGTSAFWAAFGMRTDGRPNCDPGLTGNDAKYWCFNPANHRNLTGQPLFCDGTNASAAAWIYEFGRWLDNHAPRGCDFANCYNSQGVRVTRVNIAPGYGDRFHPSVSSAVVDSQGCSISQGVNIGYWDDSGQIASLNLEFASSPTVTITQAVGGGALLNGIYTVPASTLAPLQNSSDTVKIIATDAAGNRQGYETTLEQLLYECHAAVSTLGDPQRRPSPSPSPSLSPTPTPGGGSGGGDTGGDPGSANLRSSSHVPSRGEHVRLTVRTSSEHAGKELIILGTAAGLNPGSVIGELTTPLNHDRLFDLTMSRFRTTLTEEAGEAVGFVDFVIPAAGIRTSARFWFQGIVLDGTSVLAMSDPLSLRVNNATTRNGPLQKELARKRAKIERMTQKMSALDETSAGGQRKLQRLLDLVATARRDAKLLERQLKAATKLGNAAFKAWTEPRAQ